MAVMASSLAFPHLWRTRVASRRHVYRKECTCSLGAGDNAGASVQSSTGGYSLLEVGKEPWAFHSTSSDRQYLPGAELGDPVGGDTSPLLYRPHMDHLWKTLLDRTPDLHPLPLDPDMRRKDSRKGAKRSRVFNWLLAANRLRRIRLTYFDGGAAVQAFNSLLYPDFRYDIPLLGIDLLSFGTNKILCVIDFIPLCQDPVYLDKYTSMLAPMRADIAEHCGRMTSRFYDENQFFSKELIFYRSNLGAKEPILEVPNGLLFKAYAGYIDKYFQILQGAKASEDPAQMSHVALRQAAYDKYSEERDPAIKVFSTYFGEEPEITVNNHLVASQELISDNVTSLSRELTLLRGI